MSITPFSYADFSLSATEAWIDLKFDVPQLPFDEAKGIVSDNQWLVIDIRESEEYNVSHLKGAVQWSPKQSAKDFLAAHQESLKDKKLLVYCSVGYRSSTFADALSELTRDQVEIYNLRGGIFRWFNEGLPVFQQEVQTQNVHPYNKKWGKLLLESSQE